MITRIAPKLGLLAATLFFLVPAAAQAQVPGEDEEGGTTEGEGEATGDGAASMPAPDPDPDPAPVTDAAAVRYPRSVIARPLTLPASVFQVGYDVVANKDVSLALGRLVAGYGISDKIEATLYYAMALKEFEAKGNADVNVGYAAIRGGMGGKLEVIARGQFGYSVLGEAIDPLYLGAQAQYNLSDKLAVYTPGQQLLVTLDGDTKPIALSVPVGVGYQVTPEAWVQLDTTLANIKIADSANAFIFADTTPVTVTAIYNVMPALDVNVGLGLNVTPPVGGVGDTLAFLLGVRYYGGKI